ncbi:MAG: DUF1707 and DUF4190 domain-containing protein [Streptosporangiaceae bacterium]
MGLEPMTVSGYGYGRMRATDADREGVHSLLQSAYADGRLTWAEFDARSTSLLQAKTHDELGALTADLREPAPVQPGRYRPPGRPTNSLAVVSMGLGFGQFFLPIVGAIAAIACGHAARRQIRETGESGAGMAMTGLVLGYAGVLLPVLAVIGFIVWLTGPG